MQLIIKGAIKNGPFRDTQAGHKKQNEEKQNKKIKK